MSLIPDSEDLLVMLRLFEFAKKREGDVIGMN